MDSESHFSERALAYEFDEAIHFERVSHKRLSQFLFLFFTNEVQSFLMLCQRLGHMNPNKVRVNDSQEVLNLIDLSKLLLFY